MNISLKTSDPASRQTLFFFSLRSSGNEPINSYTIVEGGVRVCGDAVQRYFWCGFAEIFILTCGIAVLQN